MGFFERLKDGLQKTRKNFTERIEVLVGMSAEIDDDFLDELEKIHRVIKREIPEAPHETFLVLDATTGQNAITQAKVFTETANVTGVVLTKLDGTAKGGVVIAIREELGLPVKWIGVGEGIMDFRPFEPEKFVDALFNTDK